MKQGKQLSTTQRWVRFSLYMLAGAVLGGLVGFFGMVHYKNGLPEFMSTDSLLLVTRIGNLIAFAVAIYFGLTANRLYGAYEESDEEEDDVVDDLYKKMYRSLEYATIFFNVAVSLTLLNIGLGIQVNLSDMDSFLFFSIIDLVFFLLLFVAQPLILKLTQKIRQYKLSAFATVKEMKDFAEAMDEGEKQANYEMSFQIVFSLNQIILPGLYLVLFFLSFILQEPQIVGYLIVAFLHSYINIMNIQMVRKYFK